MKTPFGDVDERLLRYLGTMGHRLGIKPDPTVPNEQPESDFEDDEEIIAANAEEEDINSDGLNDVYISCGFLVFGHVIKVIKFLVLSPSDRYLLK